MNKQIIYLLLLVPILLSSVVAIQVSFVAPPIYRDSSVVLKFNATGNYSSYSCDLNVTGLDTTGHAFQNYSQYTAVNSTLFLWSHQLNSGNYSFNINCSADSFFAINSSRFTVNLPVNFKNYSLSGVVGKLVTLDFFSNPYYNISDPEKDALSFANTSVSGMNLSLVNNVANITPQILGVSLANFSVTEHYTIFNGTSYKATYPFVLEFNAVHGFDFSVGGNNTIILSSTLPGSANFTVKPVSGLGSYTTPFTCHLVSADSSLSLNSDFSANNNQLTKFVVNSSSYGTHKFAINCHPNSNPLDNITKIVEFAVKKDSFSLSMPKTVSYDVQTSDFGNEISNSITFKNNGTLPIVVNLKSSLNNNIVLDSCFSSRKCTFSLIPGQSQSVSFNLDLKNYYFDSGSSSLGSLYVNYWTPDNAFNTSKTTSFSAVSDSALVPNMLYISSSKGNRNCNDMISCVSNDYESDNYMTWNLNSNYNIPVVPGDRLHFRLFLHNQFSTNDQSSSSADLSMADVEIELKIPDLSIDNTTTLDSISASSYDSQVSTADFYISLPNRIPSGLHQFEIDVSGYINQYYTNQKFTILGNINVWKNSNNVVVESMKVYPSTLNCSYMTYLTSSIVNIGRNDQNLNVELFGNNFNFSSTQTCDLTTYSSGNDICDINTPINVPQKAGTYTVGMRVLRDNALVKGPYYATITVENCSSGTTSRTQNKTNKPSGPTIVITNQTSGQNVYLLPTTETVGLDDVLLFAIVIILLIAVIVMIWFLLRK